MLNGVKIRTIYSKIQTQLFNMIPEKWEKIYLYASIVENIDNTETGEMFFYYYPKGLLKKNPINVYEIPTKFNVDEKEYMKLVNNLYETIKLLRQEFEKAKEKVWTNLTISIENLKFHVEYNYEDLARSYYTNYDRHIIWQYKYLDLSMERLSKKDRKMLEEYLIDEQFKNTEVKKHTENMYQKNIHNAVEFDRQVAEVKQEEKQNEKQLDKYELYKLKKEEEKKKQNSIVIESKEKIKKNQILNF